MPEKSPFEQILIFTDGACSGNPGPGGWGAIVCLPEGEVRELGGGARPTTNNRMEIVAALRALEAVRDRPEPIALYTDSVYVIRGITQWIGGWKKRGWKNAAGDDVANQDLWELLADEVRRRPPRSIDWRYVRGHTGVPGNERVDEIAVAFSQGKRPKLYQGPLMRYDVPIHDLPESHELPEIKDRAPKQKAYSYVSLVDGIAMRHATWPECEARVKGRSGAKFKKVFSAEEEQELLAAWGAEIS